MTHISGKMRVVSAVFGGLAAFALGLTPAPAGHIVPTGQTNSTTLQVNAIVPLTCTLGTGTLLNFGNYTGVQLDAQTTIPVTCNQPTAPWEVEYGPGLNSTSCLTRQMVSVGLIIPLNFLKYNIHADAARSAAQTLGPVGALGCTVQPGTGNALLDVFGRIPGGQTGLRVGTYTDTVAVTIHF